VPKIVVVDDDYGSEILAEHLRFAGHEVVRLSSADEALSNLDNIASADLLILDIIMAPSKTDDLRVSGGRTAGMAVFQAVRRRSAKLPILAYTATSDKDIVDLLSNDPSTSYCPKWSAPSLREIRARVQSILGLENPKGSLTAFIVHGHDDHTKLAVKNYLQNNLGFSEPIILHEQPTLGRTLIEKFEDYAGQVQFAFVVLTPDDKLAESTATNDEKRRARQNVIFELGYFLALFGRISGRVLLLHRGPLELPSDVSGLIYIDISNGIEAAGELIRREIGNALKR
jgi:predicted nucleotide-binding protein